MAIRWVSNPESIQANQPSVLAIAETLAAMGVSVWIAVTWDTYVHIAIGASIAPLLLMRTDGSCILGAQIAQQLAKPLTGLPRYSDKDRGCLGLMFYLAVALPLLFLWFAMLLLLARVAGCVVTLVRHPLRALVSIPGNLHYATVVLDSRKWPDVMPKPSEVPQSLSFPGIFFDVGELLEGVTSRVKGMWHLLLFPVFMSPTIFPTFAYRWSLKSTAIIWFPLLWAMRSVRKAGKSFPEYLSAYVRSPFSVIVLCISIAVIVTFLGKIILWSEWSGFVEWWNAAHWRRVLSLYVTPQEIQWWQVVMFVNSIVATAMYLLAVHWLVLMKYRQITTETLPRYVFHVGLFIRPILSCYTIACTLYITIRAASEWELPALGTKLFPWM